MLTFVPAAADARFEERFFAALHEADEVLAERGLSHDALAEAMRARGEIRTVDMDGEDVGSVWVELRGRTLHVHALLLDSAARGRGLGGKVLAILADEFAGAADEIELAVQSGNKRAERLYERAGFAEVGRREPGFRILRRQL